MINIIDYCNNLHDEQNNELMRFADALNDTFDTLEDMKKEYDRIYYLEKEIKQLKENK